MPSDDLLLNVRQIANYPTTGVSPSDQILLQRGGLGGPYLQTTAIDLVSTALIDGGPLQVGVAAPGDTYPPQIFTGGFCTNLDGAWLWNSYFTGTVYKRLGSGPTGMVTVDLNNGFQFFWAGPDSAATTVDWSAQFEISPTGYLTVGEQVLLARDPVAPMEAATANWVAASTVTSLNGRRGNVSLWIDDIICAGGAPIFSPRFQGAPRAETPASWSHSSRLATTAFVHRNSVEYITNLLADHPFVFSFNGRSGDVTLTGDDITAAGGALNFAPLDSPAFTGYPTAPTAPPGSQTGQLATTAFVMSAVQDSTTGVASFNGRTGIIALSGVDITGAGGATLASPVFIGTPQAPTAATGTDSAQIATCAFVVNALGGATSGVETFNGRGGAVVLTLADITGVGGAPLAAPAFSGVPTAPTAATGSSTQQLATTAFVAAAVSAGSVSSFNGRTGPVTLSANDISAAGGAALASPSFSGVPLAPTAAPGTNSAQIATTAYVMAALAATGVTSFNGRAGTVTLTLADVTTALPASTAAPLIDGTATAGTATGWSRGDHVHPTDTTRYSASNPSGFQTAAQVGSALAAYLPLTGGVVTGQIVVAAGGVDITGTSTFRSLTTFAGNISANGSILNGYGNPIIPGVAQMSVVASGGPTSLALQFTDPASTALYQCFIDTLSDQRIKKNIAPTEVDALSAVLNVPVRQFDVKGEFLTAIRPLEPSGAVQQAMADAHVQIGIVAQEALLFIPEMVNVTDQPTGRNPAVPQDLHSIMNGAAVPYLIRAIQQLAARVEQLEQAA
jgi:Chaperone of endosialidase